MWPGYLDVTIIGDFLLGYFEKNIQILRLSDLPDGIESPYWTPTVFSEEPVGKKPEYMACMACHYLKTPKPLGTLTFTATANKKTTGIKAHGTQSKGFNN